jgi:hypothetical protein
MKWTRCIVPFSCERQKSCEKEELQDEKCVDSRDDMSACFLASIMAQSSVLVILPFELHLRIFDVLDVSDILAVLSTCHELAAFARNERIFAALCARYDVRDISRFAAPHDSYYAVYTRLVHAYGPLCGLWASDAPFTGSIIQIRYTPGGDVLKKGRPEILPPGIIGEKWTFQSHIDDILAALHSTHPIIRPSPGGLRESTPHIAFHIGFHEDLAGEMMNATRAASKMDQVIIPYATVMCCQRGLHRQHDVTLSLPTSVRRQILLRFMQIPDTLSHQAFPPDNASWLRPGPAFATTGSLVAHGAGYSYAQQQDFIRALRRTGRNTWYQETEEPRSEQPLQYLCMLCECSDIDADNPVAHSLVVPDRYFPIRDCHGHQSALELDPIGMQGRNAEDFDSQAFTGLWLGDFGTSGTEVLWLEVEPPVAHFVSSPTVRASKVTGDMHVPRGAHTWWVRLKDHLLSRHDLQPHVSNMLQETVTHPLERAHIFSGSGVVSPVGFMEPSETRIIVAFFTSDLIRIWWSTINIVREYRRYIPRTPGQVSDSFSISRADLDKALQAAGVVLPAEHPLNRMYPPEPVEDDSEEIDYAEVLARDAHALVYDAGEAPENQDELVREDRSFSLGPVLGALRAL